MLEYIIQRILTLSQREFTLWGMLVDNFFP